MDLQKLVAVLKTYLDQETPNYQDGDAESLLEMLYNICSELNGFDNDLIRQDFDLLYESMNGKSRQEIH